jgi:hypothetical protein
MGRSNSSPGQRSGLGKMEREALKETSAKLNQFTFCHPELVDG